MKLKDPPVRLSKIFTRTFELSVGRSVPHNHLTVSKQDNQIDGVDQYTVHICYWYAPLRRYYLAAGDLRHCMSEYLRAVADYRDDDVDLQCHQIGFVLQIGYVFGGNSG